MLPTPGRQYISEDMRSKSKNIVSSSETACKRNICSCAGCYFCTYFYIN
nr:MAG TPA: hypothetical protein [Caudoviricetes sp.]